MQPGGARGFAINLWREWLEIAIYIGDFQSRLLLTIFYFTVLLPFGLLARFILDPLQVRRRPRGSGWIARPWLSPDVVNARRLF